MKPFDFNAGEPSERPTVVLLHSSASSSRQWSVLAEQLSLRYDVRAIDFYGHGAREPWRGGRPMSLADEAELVEPILKEAGPVHLVGHSYGGAVALKVAQSYPQSVRSLVAYEPVLFRWLFDDDPHSDAACEVSTMAAAMSKYLNRGNAYRAAGMFVNYWSGSGSWESLSARQQDAVAVRILAVFAHFDALSGATLPVSGLSGLHDRMLFLSGTRTAASTRRIAALLRTGLPGAEHQVVENAGHMGPITHAADVNRRIAGFLLRCGASLAAAASVAVGRDARGFPAAAHTVAAA